MNMYQRYEAAEKVMPYNAKKLVTNLAPSVQFKGDEVILTEQYFLKGEIASRLLVKNVATGKVTHRKSPVTTKEKPAYTPHRTTPIYSKDGRYGLCCDHYNLILIDKKTKKEYALTTDGNEDLLYGAGYFKGAFQAYLENNEPTSALFSPDGAYALVDITIAKNIKTLTITQVFNHQSTTEPMRPRDFVYRDWFPFEEDASMTHKIGLVDLKAKKMTVVTPNDFYYDPYHPLFRLAKWDKDSQGFIYVEGDKCCQRKSLYHVALDDLNPVLLGEETTDTFFQENSPIGSLYNDFGYAIHILKNGKKAIWQSSPVDQHAFFIYDFETKTFERQITDDAYNAATLLYVDEDKEIIYFMASHLDTLSDPLYGALCSIHFDGTGFEQYTKEDAFHTVTFNPENGYYVDTYSTIEMAPVTVLGNVYTKTSEVLLEANISRLLKAGYVMPKRTKITLDDGMELYGCIILPKDYNPNKKYPVIDYCYGGPQTTNTPKKFVAWGDIPGREAYGGLEAFAKLGFIGVIIDGRGTPHRGKKMHDISYQNLHGLDGLCDHEPFLRKLQKQYTGIDLDRVGIWGNSAGGYMSTRALLEYPDFFKVAVSSAGDHDNRTYNATWALRYHGAYEKDIYLAQDSAQLVNNFKGHLLLVHGLLDDNVHPSQTFRMIQYFQKANKDVDLMVLPDTDHNCPGNVYFMRRRFDYFVRHLMGAVPPANFKFSGQD